MTEPQAEVPQVETQPTEVAPKTSVAQRIRRGVGNWLNRRAVVNEGEGRVDDLAVHDAIGMFDALLEAKEKENDLANADINRQDTDSRAIKLMGLPAIRHWFPGIDSLVIEQGDETLGTRKVVDPHYNEAKEHQAVTLEEIQTKVDAEKARLGIRQEVSA